MSTDERLENLLFPDRDPSFAGLIRRLSEPESGKPADNLVSNEDSYPRVAGEVAARVPANSVYLGVGPDQNLTFIARARPRLALILDFRRRNLRLHLLHKALVGLSRDRVEYLRRLTAREPIGPVPANPTAEDLVKAFSGRDMSADLLARTRREVRSVLEPLGALDDDEWADLDKIQAKLAGPGLSARFLALTMYPTSARLMTTLDRSGKPAHWLADDAGYAAVRERQTGDRVVPVTADLAGKTAMAAVARLTRSRSLPVGAVYVSDVEFFLLRAGRLSAFAENLAALDLAPGAILIRSSTREIPSKERFPGDSSTTIVRPLAGEIERIRRGGIRTPDDLFSPPSPSKPPGRP